MARRVPPADRQRHRLAHPRGPAVHAGVPRVSRGIRRPRGRDHRGRPEGARGGGAEGRRLPGGEAGAPSRVGVHHAGGAVAAGELGCERCGAGRDGRLGAVDRGGRGGPRGRSSAGRARTVEAARARVPARAGRQTAARRCAFRQGFRADRAVPRGGARDPRAHRRSARALPVGRHRPDRQAGAAARRDGDRDRRHDAREHRVAGRDHRAVRGRVPRAAAAAAGDDGVPGRLGVDLRGGQHARRAAHAAVDGVHARPRGRGPRLRGACGEPLRRIPPFEAAHRRGARRAGVGRTGHAHGRGGVGGGVPAGAVRELRRTARTRHRRRGGTRPVCDRDGDGASGAARAVRRWTARPRGCRAWGRRGWGRRGWGRRG